ncbi:MAG TPA: hypothetical protein EYG40_07695 [Verrucomicrobia bacterium]|nr:hypothetical protein [Verrucomicrobiota bacterium]
MSGINGSLLGVTDSVLEEVRLWQNRSFDAVYPIIFLDALRVNSGCCSYCQ